MESMTWQEIRETFLRYFEERGHTVVPSASLVPADDPTLLFTNAGMVPFKNVFLGLERRRYTNAVSCQKCMRVAGKHNDLEDVGPSPRHHTFFQMLGNFSFGGYSKGKAIRLAWDLVTGIYGIPADRLIFTVFHTDDEALAAWRDLGVPEDRILRLGEKTNFWMMGDVGPVGPTSELHYDWGSQHCSCGRPDCSVALDNDCHRWLEIWNLVFMQFNQAADGTRTPLPQSGVDTGMGLERLASVLQGAPSDYEIDMFAPLLASVQRLLGHTDAERAAHVVPYRVIADHGRATAFLIADGVMPGNEGRPYVLRMIMRRAMRFGRRAGLADPFLHRVVDDVVETMGEVYPALTQRRGFIRRVVEAEEERFSQTLAAGLGRLDEAISEIRSRGEPVIPGEVAFRLYDTFGFPIEMTRDIAREQNLTVDEEGFQRSMAAQRERARAAGGGFDGEGGTRYQALAGAPATEFVGYRGLRARASVLALLRGGEMVQEAGAGDQVEVVLDRTPFYPEGGGQVGDRGIIRHRRGGAEVLDARRPIPGVILHAGRVTRGTLKVGDTVTAVVDGARRRHTMRNHTATHLLHRALQEVVGEHARQAGSLVAPDRLRFDFTHLAALTEEERRRVEDRVNEVILEGRPVRVRWMPYEQALRLGAMALFGEKYGDRVRVIEVKGYSRELCGGTHVTDTSQIALFKIVGEGSAAAGIRRIEAVTGQGVYRYLRELEERLGAAAAELEVPPAELVDRLRRVRAQVRGLERQMASLEKVARPQDVERLLREARDVDGVRLVTARLDGLGHDALRRVGDQLRDRLGSGVVVLAAAANDKVNLVSMVTADLVARGLRADDLIRGMATRVGGTGGGRPGVAQGGGRDVEQLEAALRALPEAIRRVLAPAQR